MTTVDVTPTSVQPVSPSRWQAFEQTLERLGERLNPILVKEARQALKSRQFGLTFSLLLIFVWGWTVMGISARMPEIYYRADGPYMLTGYALLLGIPLLLIVPFSAFRSLASEREDGTFELVSITTLSARQIITGKLVSAILQMLVYFSAISPCMAFTYLLRGVDVAQIAFLMLYVFAASVVLCCLSLLLATVTRSQQWNVLISVLVLAGLFWATSLWCVFAVNDFGRISFDTNDWDLWIVNSFGLTVAVCVGVFSVFAAAAQISFESDNRSTRLRIILFVSQLLMTGWMIYFGLNPDFDFHIAAFMIGAGFTWFLAGALMSGERANLSPRVRRSLPQSLLGRMFLTWFNPGSGTGFVFATTNLFVALVVAIGFVSKTFWGRGIPGFTFVDFVLMAIMIQLYVVCYLGVGRLIMLVVNKYVNAGLALPFVVHTVLAVLGIVIPLTLQNWLMTTAEAREYSALQAPNWGWTILAAANGELHQFWSVPLLTFIAATILYAINLILANAEVQTERALTPQRVEEDERELHPNRYPHENEPLKSPWDD